MFCELLRTEPGSFRHMSELRSGRSEQTSFPFLLWSYSAEFSVFALIVIPLHVVLKMLVSFVEAAKLKSFNQLPLKNAVECFDVGIFFGCSHMGKFLLGFKFSEIASHLIGQKLGAVIISDEYSLEVVLCMQPAKHHDHVMLADTPLEDPLDNLAAEHIHDRE